MMMINKHWKTIIALVFLVLFTVSCYADSSNMIIGGWNTCGFIFNGNQITLEESADLAKYPATLSLYYAQMNITFFESGKVIISRPARFPDDTSDPMRFIGTYEEQNGLILLEADGDDIILEMHEDTLQLDITDVVLIFEKCN